MYKEHICFGSMHVVLLVISSFLRRKCEPLSGVQPGSKGQPRLSGVSTVNVVVVVGSSKWNVAVAAFVPPCCCCSFWPKYKKQNHKIRFINPVERKEI